MPDKIKPKHHLSDDEKSALKKMSDKAWKTAPDIGAHEKMLVGLTTRNLATMTRAAGKLYFKKEKT